MSLRTALTSESMYRFVFLWLFVCASGGWMNAQNLVFTPGTVSLYAGDPTGQNQANPNYTGTLSGLVLNGPSSLVYDQDGNLYMVESGDNVVRVVAASNKPIPALPGVAVQAGNVYQVAGNGTSTNAGTTSPCSAGDLFGNGCLAKQAYLYGAASIAVDANGNLYIASGQANQLRVVYGAGTVPGLTNPVPGYIYAVTNVAGVGGGNGNSVPDTPDGTPVASSITYAPMAVAVDSLGNIFFADGGYSRVGIALRMIYMAGTMPYVPSGAVPGSIYTLGTGTQCGSSEVNCGVGGPISGFSFLENIFGIAVDSNENVYVGGSTQSQVFGIYAGGTMLGIANPQPGYIYAVAGTGSNAGGAFDYPVSGGVAVTTDISNSIVSTGQIAVSGGNLYIASGASLLKVDSVGILYNVLGGIDLCSTSTDKYFDGCEANAVANDSVGGDFDGVAIDPTGNIYASNYEGANSANLIQKVTVGSSLLDISTTAGLANNTNVYVANNGTADLQLSGISFTQYFSQILSGGNDCSSTTSLAPGATCLISVRYTPPSATSSNGTLSISSNALNATSNTNTIQIGATALLASSSVALTSSSSYPAVASIGQAVTFTATVSPQFQDTIIPSGTVTFISGYGGTPGSGTTLGSGTVGIGGVVTYSTSSLAAGAYPVTAVYSGDGVFAGSASNLAVINVATTPAGQVNLMASSNATNSGQSVTLTANVTPYSGSGTPTGTITFQDGANPLSNGIVMLSGGTATLTTTTLPAGLNQIVAVYSGDSNFAANTSSIVPVTVTPGGLLQFQPGTISLLAGNYFNYTGQVTTGTPATSAIFGNPKDVAADSYGNAYVIDIQTDQVYVIASGNGPVPGVTGPVAGNIYILGNGTICFTGVNCGDGGPVSQASFTAPQIVATDALNNVYVYDNRTIRKISAQTGTINTLVGSSQAPLTFSGDGGLATNAGISASGMAVDANGNIYFSDSQDKVIRRVDAQTNIIATVVGITLGAGVQINGTYQNQCTVAPCGDGGPATVAELVNPNGVAIDAADNIYIAESGPLGTTGVNLVRKVDAHTGIINTVAGGFSTPGCGVEGCGNGGPATSASFQFVSGIAVDNAGDIYITDDSTFEVREVNAQTGIINTVAGTVAEDFEEGNYCAGTPPCGDGGPATSAELADPLKSAVDSNGNLYIVDGNDGYGENVILKVSAGSLALSYDSQNLGTTTPQTVSVTNAGLQPLIFSDLSIPQNYVQQLSGGADCDAFTSLAPGASCELEIAFFPTATGPLTATASIASNSTNATGGQNIIALSGIGTGLGGSMPQTITFPAVQGGLTYGSLPILLNASATSGEAITYEVTGPATVAGSTLTITGAGTVNVTAYQFGDQLYAAATPVSRSFVVAPATLTITATNLSITSGTALPAPTFMINGFAPGDTQASATTGAPALSFMDSLGTIYSVGSTPPSGTYTITIKQGTLALTGPAASNYNLVFANGTLTVTGEIVQTVTFAPLSSVTYGSSAISLVATSTSGLPVSYTVQGPASVVGNLLTITGAGAVAVTAVQAGNAQYSSATPVTQAFSVNKAVLSVTATSVSVAQGSPIPTFAYMLSGFVNGDNQSVVTGTPMATTTATSGSPVGMYPITVAPGTLTAANYTFNLVGGTLTIVTSTAQTITFATASSTNYGALPVTLNAVSSSGLGVSYSVAGPAVLSGNLLTFTGAGTVTVTASQAGNDIYGPASPVTQSITVAPAVLTVTANNATRVNDAPNPTLTYAITGLVNNDSQGAALSGVPALATTATITSAVGVYPITVTTGSLKSANYTFNFVAGVFTITTGGPTPDFSLTVAPQALTVYQGQVVQATITLSPVNYYQGLVQLSCGSLPANVTCIFTPATLAPDGTNTSVTGVVTINTNAGSPPIAQTRTVPQTQVVAASFFYVPAVLAGLFLTFRRKQITKRLKRQEWLALLILMLVGTAGLTACGSSPSSSSSTVANPGSSVITLTAADSAGGPAHTINIGLQVQ